jgi:hypothetical protein
MGWSHLGRDAVEVSTFDGRAEGARTGSLGPEVAPWRQNGLPTYLGLVQLSQKQCWQLALQFIFSSCSML